MFSRLSVLNIFLIAVVNMYVILTGGLLALQFTYVRKYETRLALVSVSMWTLYLVLAFNV